MNWTFDSDIDEFLHKNEAAILGSESENCILLGLLNAVRQGRLEQDELVYCTGTLEGSRRPCAVLWKGKQKILLTAMDAETAEHLADALLPLGHSLGEARGSVVTCRAFAHRWSTLRERTTTEVMRQGIYELKTVTRPRWRSIGHC